MDNKSNTLCPPELLHRNFSQKATGRDGSVDRVKANFKSPERSRSADILSRRGSLGRGEWKDSSIKYKHKARHPRLPQTKARPKKRST